METQAHEYEGWSILELMGHRRLPCFVRTVVIAGAKFLQAEIPGFDPGTAPLLTQNYRPDSVYCLTPSTEERVRAEVMQQARTWHSERARFLPPAPISEAEKKLNEEASRLATLYAEVDAKHQLRQRGLHVTFTAESLLRWDPCVPAAIENWLNALKSHEVLPADFDWNSAPECMRDW